MDARKPTQRSAAVDDDDAAGLRGPRARGRQQRARALHSRCALSLAKDPLLSRPSLCAHVCSMSTTCSCSAFQAAVSEMAEGVLLDVSYCVCGIDERRVQRARQEVCIRKMAS